mgnify:CR=1 FL=1
MAYGIFLVALGKEQIDKLREHGNPCILKENEVDKIVETTHFFVNNGTGFEEFDKVLIPAIEGDQELNKAFWHPLRKPKYISPENVENYNKKLANIWSLVSKLILPEDLEYYIADFEPILKFYEFAAKNNNYVLSFLTKPYDALYSEKVIYPVDL